MPTASSDVVPENDYGTLSPEAVHVLENNYTLLTEANGVLLFVDDRRDVRLPEGVQRVYPFTDEATDLLQTARRVVAEDGQKFDRVIDCVAGGGHSMLPILEANLAERGFGIDLNPRAVNLAQCNARLNGLQDRATFMMEDLHHLDETILNSSERTLYMANPPFALTTQEKDAKWDTDLPGNPDEERLMRVGSRDGLRLTRAFITHSIAKAYAERALQHSKPGDVIIGVAYSRIGVNGNIELEEEMRNIIGNRGTFTLEPVEGATLWRGPNGKKEQPNPMPLTSMNIKGTTDQQRAEYDNAAANHLREGYDRLGYFRYIIRVGATETGRSETRAAARTLMQEGNTTEQR